VNQATESLIIVMPAYNEQDCIKKVITEWVDYIRSINVNFTFLIINDGSRDDTGILLDSIATEIPELSIVHQENSGHGKSLINGYVKATETEHDWVLQIDSDDQFLPEDFALLWEKRNLSQFILGRRKDRKDTLHRHVITFILKMLLLLIFQTYLRDSNVPFRLINKNYLKKLLNILPNTIFAPNIFLTVLAQKNKQELFEIPTEHILRQTGTVSLIRIGLIKACIRSMKELISFRLNLSSKISKL
jgi:dolichol-phosphate mannosyltransferase